MGFPLYHTRYGTPVAIFETKAVGERSLIGAWYSGDPKIGWCPGAWLSTGRYNVDGKLCSLDLVDYEQAVEGTEKGSA